MPYWVTCPHCKAHFELKPTNRRVNYKSKIADLLILAEKENNPAYNIIKKVIEANNRDPQKLQPYVLYELIKAARSNYNIFIDSWHIYESKYKNKYSIRYFRAIFFNRLQEK